MTGAVDETQLETLVSAEMLDELENWSTQITTDPIVVRALKSLEEDDACGYLNPSDRPTPPPSKSSSRRSDRRGPRP